MSDDTSRQTALLVMDVQQGIVDHIDDPDFVGRVGRATSAARDAGATIIHVRVGFRPGHPEVDERNRLFSRVKESGRMVEGVSSSFVEESTPQQGDIVVVKKRISAFAGSDLELILRARGIQDLALSGISTSGVVLSTFRAAIDLDYRVTVLSDGCADPDLEVHQVLLNKVFPAQGDVATIDDWSTSLTS